MHRCAPANVAARPRESCVDYPEKYQAYRRGQEEQLGALGLVVNAVTLWNSRYMDRAVGHLRDLGQVVDDGDLERISPLIHAHIELHGRYSFNPPELIHRGELRPLPHLSG